MQSLSPRLRILIGIALLFTSNAFTQNNCTSVDYFVDSILRIGLTPRVNEIKVKFFKYQSCIRSSNPTLFQKIKYFDFVLEGDGTAYVAMLNGDYQILDNDYKIIQTITPELFSDRRELQINPFFNGFTSINASPCHLISSNGLITRQASCIKLIVAKRGFFIQGSELDVFYQPFDRKPSLIDKGVLKQFWLQDVDLYEVRLNNNDVSVYDGNGIVRFKDVKKVTVINEYGLLFAITNNNTVLLTDKFGKKLLEYCCADSSILGRDGLVYRKQSGLYYHFNFSDLKEYALDEVYHFQPLSKNRLLVEFNKSYGVADETGKLLTPIEFTSFIDWSSSRLFFKQDEVYLFNNDSLLKLPFTRPQFNQGKRACADCMLVKDVHYRLIDRISGKEFSFLIDTFNVKDGLCTMYNQALDIEVISSFFFPEMLIKQNNIIVVKSFDLKKTLSPEMDTILIKIEGPFFFRGLNKKWGILDRSFNMTCPPKYDKISRSRYNRYEVWNNNKVGIIDQDNNLIIPCEFTSVFEIKSHFYLAKKGEESFLFDCYGTQLIDKAIQTAEIVINENKLQVSYLTSDNQQNVKTIQVYK